MSRMAITGWVRNICVTLSLVTTLLPLVAPGLALAQGPAQVVILPPAEIPVVGQPVTVDIVAEGVSNVYGAEISLRYDPTAVRLVDADPQQEGTQLTPGSLFDPAQGYVVANVSDQWAGRVLFAVTLVNPAPPVDGGGVVARLTFVPLRPGVVWFELEDVKLVTRNLQALDVSPGGLELWVSHRAITSASTGEWASGMIPSPLLLTGAPPSAGVPIWMLVLVGLAVVVIPLAGAWFVFVRDTMRQPQLYDTPRNLWLN